MSATITGLRWRKGIVYDWVLHDAKNRNHVALELLRVDPRDGGRLWEATLRMNGGWHGIRTVVLPEAIQSDEDAKAYAVTLWRMSDGDAL